MRSLLGHYTDLLWACAENLSVESPASAWRACVTISADHGEGNWIPTSPPVQGKCCKNVTLLEESADRSAAGGYNQTHSNTSCTSGSQGCKGYIVQFVTQLYHLCWVEKQNTSVWDKHQIYQVKWSRSVRLSVYTGFLFFFTSFFCVGVCMK